MISRLQSRRARLDPVGAGGKFLLRDLWEQTRRDGPSGSVVPSPSKQPEKGSDL